MFVSLVTDLATILIIIYVHDKTIRYGVYHICEKQKAMGEERNRNGKLPNVVYPM